MPSPLFYYVWFLHGVSTVGNYNLIKRYVSKILLMTIRTCPFHSRKYQIISRSFF